MPVPNSMADLAQLASANFPTGTESIGNNLDNYLRSHAAIMRSTNAVASATIAAASTTDIALADGENVIITGTATINSWGTGFVGCIREVFFSSTCTVVNSPSIPLPNGLNITTSAGDIHTYRCTAAGVWRMSARNRQAVADITGLQTALDGKVSLTGNQTIDGEITLRNAALLGSAVSSLISNGQYRFNTGNVDDIQIKAIRKAAGTGWPTAALRLQRVIDGVSAKGYIDFNGSDVNRALSFGFDIPGTDLAWLDTVGNFTAIGNITSSSDESLKTDWGSVADDFVKRLAAVKCGTYRRIDTGQIEAGVGAQSWQKVLPETVSADADGILSVDYGKSALVSAVQLAIALEQANSRLSAIEEGACRCRRHHR